MAKKKSKNNSGIIVFSIIGSFVLLLTTIVVIAVAVSGDAGYRLNYNQDEGIAIIKSKTNDEFVDEIKNHKYQRPTDVSPFSIGNNILRYSKTDSNYPVLDGYYDIDIPNDWGNESRQSNDENIGGTFKSSDQSVTYKIFTETNYSSGHQPPLPVDEVQTKYFEQIINMSSAAEYYTQIDQFSKEINRKQYSVIVAKKRDSSESLVIYSRLLDNGISIPSVLMGEALIDSSTEDKNILNNIFDLENVLAEFDENDQYDDMNTLANATTQEILDYFNATPEDLPVIEKMRWPIKDGQTLVLSYWVDPNQTFDTRDGVENYASLVQRAIDSWNTQLSVVGAPVKFVKSNNPDAAICKFEVGDNSTVLDEKRYGETLKGLGGVTFMYGDEHGYYSSDYGIKIIINQSARTSKDSSVDIIAHEIGHGLGLNHTSNHSDLMYSAYISESGPMRQTLRTIDAVAVLIMYTTENAPGRGTEEIFH